MLNLAEIDERIQKCEKILSENPGSQIFAALADSYRRRGLLDRAFAICREGLRRHPNYGPGHLVMAKLHLERRMFELAEREARLAMELEGRTRVTEILLAEIYLGHGRFADALALLEPLAATGPRDPQIKTLITKAKIGAQKSRTVPVRTKAPAAEVEPEPRPVPLDPAGALQLLRDFAGVAGAAIVSREGLVLEQVGLPKNLAEAVGAVASAIFGSTAASLPEPVFGSCEQLWIETDAARYWIAAVVEKIWVVVCRPDINFGSFKLHAEEIKRRVRDDAPQPTPLEV